MPRSRFIGWSECWRGDSTATGIFYLFFLPIWRRDWTHSTGLFQ